MYSMSLGGKRIVRLLALWLLPACGFAQYPGYKAVVDLAPLQKRFSAEAGAIRSIKSNFTQEKSLSLLAEKINSSGQFWFKRTDKIRIEYNKPFRYLVVLNQGQAMIRDEQKESKIPAQASRALRQVNHLLADVMEGRILTNSDFTTKAFEGDKNYLIELSPKSKALGSIYQSINLYIDRKDFTVSVMELLERNGDKTVMKFVQKEINADVPEDFFSVH